GLLIVALVAGSAAAQPAPPVTWNEFDVEGELQDPPDTVRTLLAPVMARRTSLTDEARTDITATAGQFGYHVASLTTRDTPAGTHGGCRLSPRPRVRKVDIDINQRLFTILLDDQVRRRMRIRTGSYLPWVPAERKLELDGEAQQLADYLHFDEGYFDATVQHE